MLHAPGFASKCIEMQRGLEEEEKEEKVEGKATKRRELEDFGDGARTIARFDIARISFVSRACILALLFPDTRGGWEARYVLASLLCRNSIEIRNRLARSNLSLSLYSSSSSFLFPSSPSPRRNSKDTLEDSVSRWRRVTGELRFGANIATPFFLSSWERRRRQRERKEDLANEMGEAARLYSG